MPSWGHYGLWQQVRVDHGTEFTLVVTVQHLAGLRLWQDRLPSLQSTSCQNRFERLWPEINQRINYPVKRVLVEMEGNDDDRWCSVFHGQQSMSSNQLLVSLKLQIEFLGFVEGYQMFCLATLHCILLVYATWPLWSEYHVKINYQCLAKGYHFLKFNR